MITWRELIVTNTEGEQTALGDALEKTPQLLDSASIENGELQLWGQHYLSAPGEEPEWDTPRVPVDWTGFEQALTNARIAARIREVF